MKNPCLLEATDIADWIRAGDIHEAEGLAYRLAGTLLSLAEAIEKDLLAPNKIGVACLTTSPELRLVAETLLSKPVDKEGKNPQSGAQRFAKLLVPNKPSKRFFTARWIAATAKMNNVKITRDEGDVYDFVVWLNQVIRKNNEYLSNFRNGLREDFGEYSPSIPSGAVTESQVIYAMKRFGKDFA